MKKKKQDKATLKQGIIVFGIFFMIIGFGLILQGIFDKFQPQFTITQEVCEEELWESNWYNLDAGDSASSLDFGEDLRYYYIKPIKFQSWYYTKDVICFDVFRKEGISPSKMEVSQSINSYLAFYIDDTYQEEFEVNGFACKGTIYEEFSRYKKEKVITKELNGITVKIPAFNYSKIRIKDWGDGYDNEFYLMNDNLYWDVVFKIVPPEPKTICSQVGVDEIKYQEEHYLGGCGKGLNISEANKVCNYNFTYNISKKDLTIDWLDENAECVEKYNKKLNSICSEKNSGSCENFPYDECYEYKYKNYTIEIK